MGQMAIRTIFDAFIAVLKITAAFIAPEIQRAIAKQTIEVVVIWHLMAGEIFTFMIAEKSVAILHIGSITFLL